MANRRLKGREYKTATCNIYDKYEFIEPQFRRGCDMNTAWEITQLAQSKLVNAHKSDKRKFGG